MTYDTKDKSIQDAAPTRFYFFEGVGKNYRYTNSPSEQTLAGEVYTPINIQDNMIEVGSALDSLRSINVVVPYNTPIAEDYGSMKTPDRLQLTIYRAQDGDNWVSDFKLIWTSKVTAFIRAGRQLSMIAENIGQSAVQEQINAIYYQQPCNHRLYDERCKVVKSDNTAVSTVVNFSDLAVEVVDDGWPDHDLKAGTILNVRSGEERLVLDNIANVISIGYPFMDIVVGDEMQLIRGCIHTYSECHTKFNNRNNYGGYPYVPDRNPFQGGI